MFLKFNMNSQHLKQLKKEIISKKKHNVNVFVCQNQI